MSDDLYPLRFEPILKCAIWGGRRLATLLNKALGEGSDYAESWEIADHGSDVSRVAEGHLAGKTLRDLIHERGDRLLGPAVGTSERFPLLVKFLDAHQTLSVQVHPDDALAHRLVNDCGKTEAWLILHAEPDSLIYAGLAPGVGADRLVSALRTGEVEPLLHRFPAKAGDCILIPAGTVHAIGAGVVLAEVQQMSDATFRLYDWGRVGADGCARPLHVEEALEAVDYSIGPIHPLTPQVEPLPAGTRERLACCPYFALHRLTLQDVMDVGSADRFTILIGLGGSARVRHAGAAYRISLGQTLFLPAEIGPCEVAPDSGRAVILECVAP